MKQNYTLKFIAEHSKYWGFQTYEGMMEDVMEYRTDEYYMDDDAIFDYLESSQVLMDEYYEVESVEELEDGTMKAYIINTEFEELKTEVIFTI